MGESPCRARLDFTVRAMSVLDLGTLLNVTERESLSVVWRPSCRCRVRVGKKVRLGLADCNVPRVRRSASGRDSTLKERIRVVLVSYLVDPASSHMLVSKIKPCMSKYKPH